MGGGEDCSRGCGPQTGLLDRKINQVLMEVLVEKEWIWWSKTAGQVTTTLGMMTSVFREGHCPWRQVASVDNAVKSWRCGPSRSRGRPTTFS